jgi:hypothetical protein
MNSRRLCSLVRLTVGNRVSQIYLALVAAVAVVTTVLMFVSQEALVMLWLGFLSLPTFAVLSLPNDLFWDATEPAWLLLIGLVASFLIQAFLLGCLARAVHRPGLARRSA